MFLLREFGFAPRSFPFETELWTYQAGHEVVGWRHLRTRLNLILTAFCRRRSSQLCLRNLEADYQYGAAAFSRGIGERIVSINNEKCGNGPRRNGRILYDLKPVRLSFHNFWMRWVGTKQFVR